jgi:hypothetical protein
MENLASERRCQHMLWSTTSEGRKDMLVKP